MLTEAKSAYGEVQTESYFEEVRGLYRRFRKDPNEPNLHKKHLRDGTVSIARLNMQGKRGFFVYVDGFAYYITQNGIEHYSMPPIGGTTIHKGGTSVFVDTPHTRNIAADELVSWTLSMVKRNRVLNFPYQPEFRTDRSRRST